MSFPFGQPSFAAGELSPSMFGRVDTAKFKIGAATVRNCFVSYRGGLYSRAGTKFCGFSKQTGRTVAPRLITFQFNINQGLALEFGNFYMRVVSNGAFVVETPKAISNIARGIATIVTENGHGYVVGEWVFIDGVRGTTQVNGQTYVIGNVTINTYQLYDVYGVAINSTAFGAYTMGGTGARVFTLTTPYAEADTAFLKFTQSADVMSLTCWNQDTNIEYAPYDLTRLADDDWLINPLNIGATTSPPASISGSSSGGGSTDFQYVATAIDGTTGQESIASPIGDVPGSVDIGSTLGSITINWSQVNGAGYYHVYKAPPAFSSTVPAGSLFGYVGTVYGTSFVDGNVTPDFSQVPPLHEDPFAPGAILDALITSGGYGLTAVTWTINSATGSGADGFPVVVGGSLTAFVFTNNGNGYEPGDTIAFNGAGFAGGAITFGANPSDGDTITLNGVVWTFKTVVVAPDQTAIKGTLALTLTQLAADLSASADANLIVANYSVTATVLNINYKTAGADGNLYTLAASAATPSGAHLTGGAGTGPTDPTATLIIGPETGTYPSVVAYFQQRRVYASSPNNPDTYWMSQPGAFKNFDSRVPTVDTDAITGTPWSVEVNGIQFLVPMPGGLVAFTGLSAWQLTGAGGSSINPQPITPANQQAQPQAYNGCNNHIPPIKIDYDINYIQAKGSILRDLSYNFFVNIYTGTDLTYLSSQLFTGYTILEMAYCEEPYKIIWLTRNDGVLLSLTYLKAQDVMGWARHDTNGQFWSVCSVTEPPVDALYLATQRYPNGNNAYMIERMDDRIWSSVEDAWCVDCALELPQPEPDATLTASSATGLGSLTGVTNLIGGQNYSAGTTAVVVDPTGSGAAPVLTIVGGVITAISFAPAGAKYSYPQLVITDPANTGSGASASPILNNAATFNASDGVFALSDVGSVIRMGGGIATITSFNSPSQVIGNITSPIVQLIPNSGGIATPQASGNWTLTAPIAIVHGLNYLIGATVTGLADGAVIPPQVVAADGSITLGQAATAITIGLGFQVQIQSLYLDTGLRPTDQGQRKRVSGVTARLEASRGGVTTSNQPDGSTLSPAELAPVWSGLTPLTLPPNQGLPPYGSNVLPLFTGDIHVPVSGGFAKPGQVAFQQDDPLPFQLLSLVCDVMPGDDSQLQVSSTNKSKGGMNANSGAA